MNNVKLGDLTIVQTGQSAPQEPQAFGNSGIPFIRAGSLQGLLSGKSEMDYELINLEYAKKYRMKLFPKDTVVFAKSGMSAKLGRVYRLRRPCYLVSHLAAVLPSEKINSGYLERWFQKNPPSRLIPNDSYPSIRTSSIADLEIETPDIEYQEHVAVILDKTDSLCQKRNESIKLLDDFLKSTFLEMFGDPYYNPMNWDQYSLGSMIKSGPQNGLYKPSSYYGKGTKILRIDSYKNGEVPNYSELKKVQVSVEEMDKYRLKKNDFVINRVNSPSHLGKAALISGIKTDIVFESNMMRFHMDDKLVNPIFLLKILQTSFIKRQILSLAKDAVNQSSINQQDVKNLSIPLPNKGLQDQFANIFQQVENLKTNFYNSRMELNNLFGSLMQLAFKGDL
jgi:type I restriction enzyme, S subunit